MPMPRKLAPVQVPAGMKYCFACCSILPVTSFTTDRKRWDGKRADCARCDCAAAYARKLRLQHQRGTRMAA